MSGLTLEAVRNFIIEKGGKVTNHELVSRFKSDLNDQSNKAKNRENFKSFVNELATIRQDDASKEKVLVLKKKYCTDNLPDEDHGGRAMSEPPATPKGAPDEVDGAAMTKAKGRSMDRLDPDEKSSRNTQGPTMGSSMKTSGSLGTMSVTSMSSVGSGGSSQRSSVNDSETPETAEDDINASVISVKDRAKHLNRMQTESDLQRAQAPSSRVKKDQRSRGDMREGDDDDSHSSGSTFVTLEPEERDWLIVMSSGDYQDIHRLLAKNPNLVRIKDLSNGYNAVHWAAKHGSTDLLKLVAGKCSSWDFNRRSFGGYTPLHIASMHGHEAVIELLVRSYKADANIRDYSGRKPKQYLSNSASSKAQQMLLSGLRLPVTGARSLDGDFSRGTSFRGSTRAKAINSLIQTTSVGMRKAMLRTSWAGSSDQLDATGPNRLSTRSLSSRSPSDTPPGSATTSPLTGRRQQDKDLMPPPSAPLRKYRGHAQSVSRENLQEAQEVQEGSLGTRSESEPSLRKASSQTYV